MDQPSTPVEITARSRKWVAFLIVFWVSTLFTAFSYLVSWSADNHKDALMIMTGTQWATFVWLLYSTYVTGNVIQKKIEGL